ncbi:MAG: NTP transferase domain-containing protein [Firmicutes bacterium]|nr:NTP transferase domain-containing protein [Bacillota bacterium]
MLNENNINCIFLCGGKGTRMQSETKHKVCFEIDGVPAILRSLNNFDKAGLSRFIVVVGALSGQVVECIGGSYPKTTFVYQKEQKGTGNAAGIGYSVVEKFNISGPVIITMGDKITDDGFIRRVVNKFYDTKADLILSVQPKEVNPTGGRVVFDEGGKPIGIVEELDAKKALVYKKFKEMLEAGAEPEYIYSTIEEYATGIISGSKKREKVLNEIKSLLDNDNNNEINNAKLNLLYRVVSEKAGIKIGNKVFDPEYIDNSPFTNASFYMLSQEAARYAFPLLSDDNAQEEEYLTDIVEILASSGKFKLELEATRDKYEIMSFNNVEELLKIEDYYRKLRISGAQYENGVLSDDSCYKAVNEWIWLFENKDKDLMACLTDIYGNDESLINERREIYLKVLRLFAERYGRNRKVVISRAPGRINIMGRHIDHRGGNVNVMSINKEVIVVAAGRDDDRVTIVNTSDEFKEREFSISEHLIELDWDSWLSYLESGEIEKMVINAKGDWVNYVKAPILRLQYQFRDRKLKGMDMAFTGNIPIAAGLSSLSAIVVSTAEAFHVLNGLDLTPQRFVELCGEGEWYVGSRGGAADHAAMKFTERGYIVKLGFLPFSFEDIYSFPEGYKLIIANSHVKANKTTNSKDAFNSRVAAYEFGVMIFKDKFPQYKGVVEHLRDINTDKLGVPPSKIYEMLLELPERVKPEELFALISEENHGKIKRILASHNPPDYYYVRAVTMFGIAECCRARLCKEMLEAGKIEEFGKMMNISHNGDRVVYYDEEGNMHEYDWSLPDAKLKELINDLRSENPERVLRAQIERQPGGYACSIPEIDYIVDMALRVKGVMGAQISGAGLGGCVMILVEEGAVDALVAKLEREYYAPRDLDPGITVCAPVKGSGLVYLAPPEKCRKIQEA